MQRTFKVAGIGELLWDFLPQGKQLGGAPFNFAFHAYQAGCQPFVVSAIGTDILGEDIIQRFSESGLDSSFVQQVADYSTGTVSVSLDNNGKPAYTIHEQVAWDYIQWNSSLELLAKNVDAVCFGSLAQRNQESRQTILKFLKTTRSDCLRIFDINLRQLFYTYEILVKSLEFSSILKLSDEELPIVASLLEFKGTDEELLDQLMQKFNLKLIALTKGDKGSLLFTKNGKSYLDSAKINVADTVGAGDSFTAVLVTGLLNEMELDAIHKTAVQTAAFVCTQKGATPKIPDSILQFKI